MHTETTIVWERNPIRDILFSSDFGYTTFVCVNAGIDQSKDIHIQLQHMLHTPVSILIASLSTTCIVDELLALVYRDIRSLTIKFVHQCAVCPQHIMRKRVNGLLWAVLAVLWFLFTTVLLFGILSNIVNQDRQEEDRKEETNVRRNLPQTRNSTTTKRYVTDKGHTYMIILRLLNNV